MPVAPSVEFPVLPTLPGPGSETNDAGFHIPRSLKRGRGYERIASSLIPAEGSPVEGTKYKYVDKEVGAGPPFL